MGMGFNSIWDKIGVCTIGVKMANKIKVLSFLTILGERGQISTFYIVVVLSVSKQLTEII